MSRVALTHPTGFSQAATIETPTIICLLSHLFCCIIIFSTFSRDSGLSAINFGILAFDKFHWFKKFSGDAYHWLLAGSCQCVRLSRVETILLRSMMQTITHMDWTIMCILFANSLYRFSADGRGLNHCRYITKSNTITQIHKRLHRLRRLLSLIQPRPRPGTTWTICRPATTRPAQVPLLEQKMILIMILLDSPIKFRTLLLLHQLNSSVMKETSHRMFWLQDYINYYENHESSLI